MKILILQASPRANGNTAWMAEEYKNAAEAAGHEVTLVNVSKKRLPAAWPVSTVTTKAMVLASRKMTCRSSIL